MRKEKTEIIKYREWFYKLIVTFIFLACLGVVITNVVVHFYDFGTMFGLFAFTICICASSIIAATSICTIIAIFIPSLLTCLYWLNKSCCEWPISSLVSGTTCFKIHTQSIATYRSIELLNELHNKAFGSILLPIFKLLLMSLLLIITFCIIKLGKAVGLVLTILFLVDLLLIISCLFPGCYVMSEVFNLSSKFHKNMTYCCTMEDTKTRIELRKTLLSLPVLKSRIGSFYHMEGRAKLTLVDKVTHGIFFMLVTFN